MLQLVSSGAQGLTPGEAQKLFQVFQAIIHNVHRNHDFQVWKPSAISLGISEIMDVKHVGIFIDLRSRDALGQDSYLALHAACQNFMGHLLADLRQQSVTKQPESLVWCYLPWDSAEGWWEGNVELSSGEFEMANVLATRRITPKLKLAWNRQRERVD